MKRAVTMGRSWVLCLVLFAWACGGGDGAPAGEPERAAYEFTGTVQAVDTAAGRVTVFNDDIPGWMAPMAMSYAATPSDALTRLEVGNRVRATVYEGDFTTLHDLQVAPD